MSRYSLFRAENGVTFGVSIGPQTTVHGPQKIETRQLNFDTECKIQDAPSSVIPTERPLLQTPLKRAEGSDMEIPRLPRAFAQGRSE